MSTAGRHLVASHWMLDPNFARTVVFMLEHNDDGALGVVLNRPSELPVAGTVDEWAGLAAAPGVVFAGGPVSTRSVITLAAASPEVSSTHFKEIHLGLGTVDIAMAPERIPGLLAVRLFAGYASWGAGLSSKPSLTRTPGTWSTHSRTTCTARTPRRCGGRCWPARTARCRASATSRTTSPTTDAQAALIAGWPRG